MEEDFAFEAHGIDEHAIPSQASGDLEFVSSGSHPITGLEGKSERSAAASGATVKHKTPVGYTVATDSHVVEYDQPLGTDTES